MIIISNLNKDEFRYERKFVTSMLDFPELISLVKLHPSAFKEIHEERRVNNIYLDYEDMKNYKDSIEGHKERLKVRIRWYGKTFGKIKGVLEIKLKDGLLGKKYSFPLSSFTLNKGFSMDLLRKVFSESWLPRWVLEKMKSYKPVMLNSYSRRYFLSQNKKVRMTLDFQQEFFSLVSGKNNFAEKISDKRNLIIELKYNEENSESIKEVVNHLPFRLTQHSKYTAGFRLLQGE